MLEAIRDSIDDLPDPIRSEYTEREGKFYLQVKEVNGFALEDIGGLKKTLQKFKQETQSLNTKLLAYGDIDPEKAKTAIEKQTEYELFDPNKQKEEALKEYKAKAGATHKKEIAERDARYKALRSELESTMIDNSLITEIVKVGGNAKLLTPFLRPRLRMVSNDDGRHRCEILDESGNPDIDSSGKPLSISQLVDKFHKDNEFSALFTGKGSSGSGAVGTAATRSQVASSGNNGFKYIPNDPKVVGKSIDDIAKGHVIIERK